MQIIEGNLLEVPRGILGHQVNCVKKMGAGLALQIRRKWPSVYEAYRQEEPELGKVLLVEVEEDLHVANLYAQWEVGRSERQTDPDPGTAKSPDFGRNFNRGPQISFKPDPGSGVKAGPGPGVKERPKWASLEG